MRGEWASYVLVDRTFFWTPNLSKKGFVFEGLKSSVLKRTVDEHSWQIQADKYNITLGMIYYILYNLTKLNFSKIKNLYTRI